MARHHRQTAFAGLILCLIALTALTPVHAQGYSKNLPWDFTFGDPSVISVYFRGQLQQDGGSTKANQSSDAFAGGSLFGNSKEYFNASTLYGYADKDAYIRANVRVIGNTIYSRVHLARYGEAIGIGDTVSRVADLARASATYPVGPIPVTVTVGVNGLVGLSYFGGITPTGSIQAVARPFVGAHAYGKAAVDFGFVGVGAGVDVTMMEAYLPISGALNLAPNFVQSEVEWGFAWNYNVRSELDMLSGRIFLFSFFDFVFGRKTFTYPLFSWPGFQLSKTLHSDSGWTTLGIPFPVVKSLPQDSALVGSSDFTLSVRGSGFSDGSTVFWGGSPLKTTFVSKTLLKVPIPAYLTGDPGTVSVTVANPPPLNLPSNALPFRVILPPPSVLRVEPGGATAGGSGFTLILRGSHLLEGAKIRWNGIGLPTTHRSDAALEAFVPATYIATPGQTVLTVVRGSDTSNPIGYTIFEPKPSIATLTPGRVWPGSQPFSLHIQGSGFVDGSTAYWNGTPLQTRYVSGVELAADVPASHVAREGVSAITVLNPPSSPPSNAVALAVAPVRYSITDLGVPNGFSETNAYDINASGQVTGVATTLAGDQYINRGFIWDSASGMRLLSTLGGSDSRAGAINRIGQVAGMSILNQAPPQYWHATVWQGADVFDLGPKTWEALDINDIGQAVGISADFPGSTSPGGSPWGAFLWQSNRTYQLPLLYVQSGTNFVNPDTEARAINNKGRAVGFAMDNSYNYHLVMWEDLQIQKLFNFGGRATFPNRAGFRLPSVTDINDFDQIVGSRWTGERYGPGHPNAGDPIFEGFLFQDGQLSGLGREFDPLHINSNGEIVGRYGKLYMGGQIRYLHELVVDAPQGSYVTAAGINDKGQLAGSLFLENGQWHACLLTPVKSASMRASINSAPTITRINPDSTTAGGTRLVLTLDGSDFVPGTQTYWNGNALPTAFVTSSRLQALVPTQLLTDAGLISIVVVNPGGETSNLQVFPLLNRRASLSSMTPSLASAGGADFTLTVTGSRFLPNSKVYWNGHTLATQYVSATNLTATVSASNIATGGMAAVVVVNPAPGGGNSETLFFRVLPPTPQVTEIIPATAQVGDPSLTLTVTGSGFGKTSVVNWDHSPLSTTFVSPTNLTVHIPASMIAQSGTGTVSVTDTVPGSWPSKGLPFTIRNPKPSLMELSPGSAQAGGSGFTLAVTGSGFVAGARVFWNGAPLNTTYVSATQLKADVSAADLVVEGQVSVTVSNPIPNAGKSAPLTFTVTSPPGLNSISPNMAKAGGSDFTLTVNGSGFASGAAVYWNGTPLETTYLSATQLTAAVPAGVIAVPGTVPVTVVIPGIGRGVSRALPFTIYNRTIPRPVLASLEPDTAVAGDAEFILIVNGSGFVSGSVVTWNGVARDTAFLSETKLAAVIPASAIASAGQVTVRVDNPGGGPSNTLVFTIK